MDAQTQISVAKYSVFFQTVKIKSFFHIQPFVYQVPERACIVLVKFIDACKKYFGASFTIKDENVCVFLAYNEIQL